MQYELARINSCKSKSSSNVSKYNCFSTVPFSSGLQRSKTFLAIARSRLALKLISFGATLARFSMVTGPVIISCLIFCFVLGDTGSTGGEELLLVSSILLFTLNELCCSTSSTKFSNSSPSPFSNARACANACVARAANAATRLIRLCDLPDHEFIIIDLFPTSELSLKTSFSSGAEKLLALSSKTSLPCFCSSSSLLYSLGVICVDISCFTTTFSFFFFFLALLRLLSDFISSSEASLSFSERDFINCPSNIFLANSSTKRDISSSLSLKPPPSLWVLKPSFLELAV